MRDTPRDANHALIYAGLRAKHLYKERVAPGASMFRQGLTDTLNGLAGVVLGGVSASCYLVAELCEKGKNKCQRREKMNENLGR